MPIRREKNPENCSHCFGIVNYLCLTTHSYCVFTANNGNNYIGYNRVVKTLLQSQNDVTSGCYVKC